jgi:hypothetical protein
VFCPDVIAVVTEISRKKHLSNIERTSGHRVCAQIVRIVAIRIGKRAIRLRTKGHFGHTSYS